MAHISKYKLKDGSLRYRAHVHRSGETLTQSGFPDKNTAKRWADEQERSILLSGLPLARDEFKKHTVADVLKRYLKEIAPSKGSYVSIEATINKTLRYDIAKKRLNVFEPADVYEYIVERQKETWQGRPIQNSTIKRDLAIFASAFSTASDLWKGFRGLPNSFAELNKKKALPNSDNRRERRLKEGEENKLWEACQHCLGLNRIYVPLAIALVLHTGMRLQEIFNLTWRDIDFKNRRIEIRKSKTDHLSGFKGRTIVLTVRAEYFLGQLAMELSGKRLLKPDARIFPMTKGAFKQSWADVRKRAGIKEQLTFHDLRHEAASRFDEADLSRSENNLMRGEIGKSMADRYIHADLSRPRASGDNCPDISASGARLHIRAACGAALQSAIFHNLSGPTIGSR